VGKLIIGLIVGLILGALGGMTLGGGAMMGAGVATGLSTGVCSTMQAAQELEFMTPEQVDQVLIQAAKDISGKAKIENEEQIVDSAAGCASFMESLSTASN